MRYAIGIDLGGTKIEVGIVDQEGNVYQKERLETLAEQGPQMIQKRLISTIQHLRNQFPVSLLGIGVGVAGQIDPQTGLVIFAPNLDWHDYPLKTGLEEALEIPVFVLNDVRAITFGEWKFGAGRREKDLLCAFIGTGIGGGIVSNGQLLTGHSNTFGEIGHITVDFNGPLCTCGKEGCLEAFAGGWGIAARAQELLRDHTKECQTSLILEFSQHTIDQVSAKSVVQAYRLGDPIAKLVIEQAEKALISGFSSLVNAYNPSSIILGGGVLDGLPEMRDKIAYGVNEKALKAATKNLKFLKSGLGKEGGVVGAAAALLD